MSHDAVVPWYPMSAPDEAIRLYEGLVTVSADGYEKAGAGSVFFEWQPYPHVAFECTLESTAFPTEQDDFVISLNDVGGRAPCILTKISQGLSGPARRHVQ